MHNSTIAPLGVEPQHAPRRGRRAVAAIATTVGVAAVVSSTLAAPAVAEPGYGVWDRVASCESSNRWHIATGNGFYGGLQFTASTWAAFGGHRYAYQANDASRTEQIAVARRVLAAQGPHAWPVCGPRAGLTRWNGGATAGALPGVAIAPARHVRHVWHHATRHAVASHRVVHRAHRWSHDGATYRVRRGNTLSGIAHRFHMRGGWRALFRANRHHVRNPNLIFPGQVLRLP